MRKYHLIYALITCLIFAGSVAFSQGENNSWAFGIYAGFDFNSGEPKLILTESETSEGAACVSDKDGKLLFYSDGKNVFNREHKLMPNGDSILGNNKRSSRYGSATQGVAIVPLIGQPGRYYLFTLDCDEAINMIYPGYLRYSIIDMELDNGLGDVVAGIKNIVLDSNTSEKMAVAAGAGCYLWLLTHTYGSSEFKARKIDATGISASVSSFATSLDNTQFMAYPEMYMTGEMKVSSDNKMIALVNSGIKRDRIVELFSFDNMTGKVQDPMLLYAEDSNYVYSVSFSPNSRLIYVPANNGFVSGISPLWQFDLSLLPDIASVRKSKIRVGPLSDWTGIRTGPDNKIYINGFNNNIINRINHPDLRGDSCDIETLDFKTPQDVHFQVGFGNGVLSLNDISKGNIDITHDTFLCDANEDMALLNAPSGFQNFLWSDGSTDSTIAVEKGAEELLWVKSTNACGVQTDTFHFNTCTDCLFFPNVFTPNKDGINDYFGGFGTGISEYELHIYDRWGNLIFTSTNLQNKWNGMYKASFSDVGTYFYYAKAKCENKKEMTLKGDILLLR